MDWSDHLPENPSRQADILKNDLDVRILGIGIGQQAMTRTAISEMEDIVSSPIDGQTEEYWQVNSFYDLSDISRELANEVCREARNNGNGGSSDEVGELVLHQFRDLVLLCVTNTLLYDNV